MRNFKKYILDYICLVNNPRFIHYFRLYSILFISSVTISTIVGSMYINLPEKVIFLVKNYTSLRFSDLSMLSILANNFLVSILLLFYFYLEGKFKRYFGIIYFSQMGVITGFALSIAMLKYNIIIALSMIVPHGIVEVPTIIYAVSSGWALSDILSDKNAMPTENALKGWSLSELKNKKTKTNIPKEFIFTIVALFALLTIASYIETHITPLVFERLVRNY